MADVNINFTGGSDDLEKDKKILQDMLKISREIKKNLGDVVGDDDIVRQKKQVAEMLKAENSLTRQEKIAENLAKSQQKSNDAVKQGKGIIGGLEKQAREYTKAWKSATTQIEKATAKKNLDRVKKQLTDAKNTTASWSKALGSFAFKFNALGNIAANALGKITEGAKKFLQEAIKMSLELEGVKNAFDKINDPQLLARLQNATRGMVNNLELMKGAVNAKNLGIPIENLGTFFEFATNRSIETGESVNALVDDIVKGLGRKSVLILDNLGLSVIDINEEFKKTGDFVVAASNVIEREMEKSGVVIDTNLVLVKQMSTEFENLKLQAGTALQEVALGVVNLANSSIVGGDRLLEAFGNRQLRKAMQELADEQQNLITGQSEWDRLVAEDEERRKAQIVTLTKLREQLAFKKTVVEATNVADKAAIILAQQQVTALEDQIKAIEALGEKEPIKILDVKQLEEDADEWESEFEASFNKQTEIVETAEEAQSRLRKEALKERREERKQEEQEIKEGEQRRKQILSQVNASLSASSSAFFSSKEAQLDNFYDAEIEAAQGNETKIKAIQKERAKAEQDLAVKKALVDGALAIVKTFTSYGGFTPAALIAAASQAVVTSVQIAAIKAQKFEHGGLVGGQLHSSGGTAIEAEKGEYVINRHSTSKYKNLIEGINENDQLKIMMAMDKDRMMPTVREDVWGKKLYDYFMNKEDYGETPGYYVMNKGTKKTMIKKNEV